MADVFAAVDTAAVLTAVTALIVGLVAVDLVFFGRRLSRKAGIR